MRGVRLKGTNIQSVLFCCNYNSVRSPMAEGIFKKVLGQKIFVQSAGIYDTREIDGFTVRVCDEIDVKLTQHRVRSLYEVEKQGGFISSFDLVIPLSNASLSEVQKYSKYSSVIIESWLINEPLKEERDINLTLESYRVTRDLIFDKICSRFNEYFP